MAPVDLSPTAGWQERTTEMMDVKMSDVKSEDVEHPGIDTRYFDHQQGPLSSCSSSSSSPRSPRSPVHHAGYVPFDYRQFNPMGSVEKTGIDVLVVGTGLAGLAAALECARKGHSVRMLERNSSVNMAGDMYYMGVSATRFFKHWPAMKREFDSISLANAWIQSFKYSGEEVIPAMKVADRLKSQGMDPDTPPGTFQMRPLVYKMFVRQVERLGILIRYNRNVVDYLEDDETGKGIAICDDGHRYEGDVVIAADGIGSKSQRIVGGQVKARRSGRAMWRAAFPIEHLDKHPRARDFFKMANDGHDPIVRTFFGPGTYALTLTRPDTMIWIVNHDVNGTEAESWQNTVSKEDVLREMGEAPGDGWSPAFKDLVDCTPPDTIVNFELLWRNPQPSWCSPGGKVVQIGDSAHSYLPASGNGATQAIEDAVSLASCLHIGGRRKIQQSVRAHIKMRFTRNACAQKLGFANAELLQDTKWDEVKVTPRQAAPKFPRWITEHDPEAYAYENYGLVVDADKRGKDIYDDQLIPPNYPPGYKFHPWTIDQIMGDIRDGRQVDLGEGDWE